MEQVLSRKNTHSKRIHELDLFRGILIILVLIDHLMNYFARGPYLGFLYRIGDFYWNFPARFFIQKFVALPAFVLLSGISCSLSKNNASRAGKAIFLWGLIAIVSNILYAIGFSDIFGINIVIDFNVIGVIAWSNLIYCLFEKYSWKILLACVIAFLLISFIFVPWLKEMAIASNKYESTYLPIFWPKDGGKYYADYMPLFPYITFFFIGAILGRFLYSEKKSLLSYKNWEKPICFFGHHSLLIYIAHQFIYVPIFLILGVIFG